MPRYVDLFGIGNGSHVDRLQVKAFTERDVWEIKETVKRFYSDVKSGRTGVSGSSYYGQLMEKTQAVSSEFITSRDSILIDLSSWYRESLAPKIETIQDAIGDRRLIKFRYYAPSGESERTVEPYYLVFRW